MEIYDPDKIVRKKSEEYEPNGYKILCGKIYKVYRTEFGGNVFYKIKISKMARDGTNTKVVAYKNVAFFSKTLDCNIKDGTLIMPKKIMEDFFFSKADKYNAIWTVAFLDWEVIKSEEQALQEAIDVYQKTKSLQIEEDMLPF